MSEHELEKLLGGFAADTLTAEEKQRLYTAAIQDQQLFNALADEQALKELLADPTVRRRLLQALNQNGAGAPPSWLDWFRRPANLALAGGLASALFAVVLGTKIYQDSLKEAAFTTAREDAAPAPAPEQIPPAPQQELPQAVEPPAKNNQPLHKPAAPPARDFATDKLSKREQSSALKHFEEQRGSDALRPPMAPLESDQPTTQADSPIDQVPTAQRDQPVAAGGKAAALTPPPIPMPQGSAASTPSPAAGPAAGMPPMKPSARSLFYGARALKDSGLATQEQERAMRPLAKTMPQMGRLERKKESTDAMEPTAEAVSELKPLGLRYTLVSRESDGVKPSPAERTEAPKSSSTRLIVEANQDSFLQIWDVGDAANPRLLIPNKDSGKISMKIAAGQRVEIPLPPDARALSVRLARAPFGPITKQEALLLNRPPSSQVEESAPSERAVYVVNQDHSPGTQLTVEIRLDN